MEGKRNVPDLLKEIDRLKVKLEEKELELQKQSEAFTEIRKQKDENEKMLHSLVEAAAGKIGQDFFDNIVTSLAKWLKADCVLIGQMRNHERIHALPLYLDGKISHEFSYALEDTPCSQTCRKGFCAYPEDVINLFPKDEILVDLNAQGYIGSALYNDKGDVNGVICAVSREKLDIPPYAQDIMKIIGARVTAEIERQKMEQALLQSQEELKESNATKDKFFSILGHDLLSPLGTIYSYTDLLFLNYDKYDPQRINKYLKTINQGARNIIELLQDMLSWSRSQRGVLKFRPEKVNLGSLIADTNALLDEVAKHKQIKLTSEIPDEFYISADRNMLATTMRNLVSNALKFTPRGGYVKISCCGGSGVSNEQVEISVEDNGIGMDRETLNNLFRIDKDTVSVGTENEKGTGLGLILCKEFIEKHKGTICAESESGKGSRFIITLDRI